MQKSKKRVTIHKHLKTEVREIHHHHHDKGCIKGGCNEVAVQGSNYCVGHVPSKEAFPKTPTSVYPDSSPLDGVILRFSLNGVNHDLTFRVLLIWILGVCVWATVRQYVEF